MMHHDTITPDDTEAGTAGVTVVENDTMADTSELLRRSDVLEFGSPDKPVSTLSRWSDLTWRLNTNDPGYVGGCIPVRWWPSREEEDLPTPSELAILDDMKRLVWLGLFHPALTFTKKATGIPIIAYGCASLLRFMTENSLVDFADLTPDVVDEFVTWTADDLRGREKLRSGKGKVGRIALHRILPLLYIWKAREYLRSVGVPVPMADPLRGSSAFEVTRQICKETIEPLPAIPNEAFLSIVNAAADIVLVHADDVLAAQNIWLENTGTFGTVWSRMRAKKALAAYKCKTTGKTTTPWPCDLLDPMINSDGIAPTLGLRRMITTLRDACVIIVLATAGLRIREIVAIAGGRVANTELADCISSGVSSDGLLELFSITSHLTKGQILPLETSWLLGSRPNGIGPLPLAAHAVNVLETLMAPWRIHSLDPEANGALIVNLPRKGLPRSGSKVHRIATTTLISSLHDFYRVFCGLDRLPDVSADGTATDLRQIKKTQGRCLSVLQYRKSYAQNIVRIDSGLMPAIQRQLQHMRISTTQLSYIGNDPRVLGSSNDEQRMSSFKAIAAFLGLTEGNGTGGRLMELISSSEQAMDQDAESLSVEDLDELGLALISVDHGLCGIQFAPNRSRCNGLSGNASFLNREPDLTRRTPSVCAGCDVFGFDRTHRPFWAKRLKVNREIWEQACARGLEDNYKVAEFRMKQAASIIAKIDKGSST